MNLKEADKIIAEFMGWKFDNENIEYFYLDKRWESGIYEESLDALVPVWEKLEVRTFTLFPNSYPYTRATITIELGQESLSFVGKSYSDSNIEAAIIATVKAIKELNTVEER